MGARVQQFKVLTVHACILHMYIYMWVCVSVCVCKPSRWNPTQHHPVCLPAAWNDKYAIEAKVNNFYMHFPSRFSPTIISTPPSRPLLSGIFLGNFMQKQFITELQKPSSKPGHKSIVSYGCSFCSCPSCTYRPMRCHFVAHKAAVRNVSTLGKIVYNTFVIANILKNMSKILPRVQEIVNKWSVCFPLLLWHFGYSYCNFYVFKSFQNLFAHTSVDRQTDR